MALREKKAEAIRMRVAGATYTEIKAHLNVSRSSLSYWLHDMPLSKERMDEVRGKNPLRIERYRATRLRQRKEREAKVVERFVKDLGELSKRDLFIAGLFLYWGEGSKTQYSSLTLSNTDPTMICFYLKWLELLGVPREKIKIRLQLYVDMNPDTEVTYWMKVTKLPKKAFRNPYIKKSSRLGLSYTQRFTHGTCNVIYNGLDIAEYILLGCRYFETLFAEDVQI